MKIIDLNILLYAHNLESVHHEKAKHWLEIAMSSDDPIAFPWVVILGFLRISTNGRVFTKPLSPDEALTVVQSWLKQPITRILNPREEHWRILNSLLRETGMGGNLTTDAHLAALAIENGCELWSTDNDFRRFPRLKWINPFENRS